MSEDDDELAPALTAHELARQLLAGPDIEVHISTDCCGCFVEAGGCETSRREEDGDWVDCVVITETKY